MQIDADIVRGPGIPGLVSVIIPSYNRARLLGETLESVLAQSYRLVEALVVDDGSVDDTREVVERFGPPVRYLYQPNAGVAAARNTGLRAARGEFIAFLDSDDLWMPSKLAAQVALLQRFADLGLVWTDMRAVNEAGELVHERYLRKFYSAYDQVPIEEVCASVGTLGELWEDAPAEIRGAPFYKGDLFSQMLLGNLVHTSTVVTRRSMIAAAGGIDESLQPAGEDYEFHLRLCAQGEVGLLDVPSIDYRIGHSDQITGPRYNIHFARSNLITILRWLDRGKDRITLSTTLVSNRLAGAYAWVGMAELNEGNFSPARAHLLRSLMHRVGQPRVLLYLLLSLLPLAFFTEGRKAWQSARRVLRPRRLAVLLFPALSCLEPASMFLAC